MNQRAPWSLHLLAEVLSAFTVESPTALRDVVSRVAEAVDAEVTAILRRDSYLLCTGLSPEEQPQLLALAPQRHDSLPLAAGTLHLFWAPLGSDDLLVVGRIRESYSLEERALLRGMGRSIQLSTQVLSAVKAEQEALRAEKLAKERAIREATLDHLTGLPNRRLLLRHLADLLDADANADADVDAGGRARGRGRGLVAALFIDLDRFKQINDLHGHGAGDQVLRQVARKLRSLVRDDDVVARMSGDEFVMISQIGDLAAAFSLAGRILERLQEPLQVQGRALSSLASIGIALAEPGDTPETLLANADLAMYTAKQQGGGRSACFDRSLRERLQERVSLEDELRRALAGGQLEAWFQPILAVAHGGVVGFEALARWRHPQRGLLLPGQFIAVAEEAGLLRDLDAAVLEHACLGLGRWAQAAGGITPRLSVNVSATSLADPLLRDRIATLLQVSGFPADHLFLEITETTLVEDATTACANISAIEALGIRLAIDDFGTGYSSLRYLKRFPVGILKIDRSFVDGLGRNSEDDVIVETVIRMARSLGIEVVAEGVETEQQAEILRLFGCHYVQGFLYGRPADAAISEALFQQSLSWQLGVGRLD